MLDPLVLLDVTGDQLCQALENGVSQWPKLEGRFPQVIIWVIDTFSVNHSTYI